jgi:hypothetical protein
VCFIWSACSLLILSVRLNLKVHYPEGYPDVLPELSMDPINGEFTEDEMAALADDMKTSVCRFCPLRKLQSELSLRAKRTLGWP